MEEDGFDPDQLFTLLQRHRLMPLASLVLPKLEERDQEKWKAAVKIHTIRSLQLAAKLSEIVTALNTVGIEAFPLKGPVLAHRLYGDVGERQFVDLDILIPDLDLNQVTGIMNDLGFLISAPDPALSDRKWAYYIRHKKHFKVKHREQPVLVEIHTGINNQDMIRKTNEESFWKQKVTLKLGDQSYTCMDLEYTFLYLLLHGGLHQYRRLSWLRDIAEALRRWELDHVRIIHVAEELDLNRILGLGLRLAEEFFQAEIPDVYHPSLHQNRTILDQLKRYTLEMIEGPEFPSISGKLRRHRSMLLYKPGINHRISILTGITHRWYIGKFLGG